MTPRTITIKALSIKQPWANDIAAGRKTIETRYWSTSYRGPLLIVSCKRPDIPPAGCAVALARLVACRRMTEADEDRACCVCDGDEFAWVLEDVIPLTPFPVRGLPGIYSVRVGTRPGGLFDGYVSNHTSAVPP